jgi:hypothetical protein
MREVIVPTIFETASTLINLQAKGAMYIDPNTGGLLFQILAVLFGLISGIILIFSSRIKMIYFRIKRSIKGSEAEDDLSDETQD